MSVDLLPWYFLITSWVPVLPCFTHQTKNTVYIRCARTQNLPAPNR